jgi:phosphoribosylformylglycinamidine synthase
VTAVHDLSDGGLAVGLAEMAMAGGVGAVITATAPQQHAFLFGEDQARYVVTAHSQDVAAIEAQALAAGVPLQLIGQTGGEALTLPGETPIVIVDLVNAHEGWLPAYMASAPK